MTRQKRREYEMIKITKTCIVGDTETTICIEGDDACAKTITDLVRALMGNVSENGPQDASKNDGNVSMERRIWIPQEPSHAK